jgi:adenine/guanine phosphoribosyltransferase-like PRPP-binding protein
MAQTVISSAFPSAEYVAKKLGLSSTRMRSVEKLLNREASSSTVDSHSPSLHAAKKKAASKKKK